MRRAVFERAKGTCEGCRWKRIDEASGHLDHFFGRAKAAETVENCWALCLECDTERTALRPSAIFWYRRYLCHAARLFDVTTDRDAEGRWLEALDRVLCKILALRAKGLA